MQTIKLEELKNTIDKEKFWHAWGVGVGVGVSVGVGVGERETEREWTGQLPPLLTSQVG